MSSLHVKQVRSIIGTPHNTRLVVAGLGLRGIGSAVTVANTPSFRGMVKKVLHLVEVSEVSSDGAAKDKPAASKPKAAPASTSAAPAKAAAKVEAKKEPAAKPAKKG